MAQYDSRTALVVVDMQNDFADEDGALYVQGGDGILDTVNEEIEVARAAGALVAYTQDWHPEHTPHFEADGGVWPVHCVRETWGAALHPELLIVEGPVVRKGIEGEDGYSGFSVRDPRTGAQTSTVLEGLLHERAVERVVVIGLATDYCVLETALDSARLGFDTTVLTEAIRAVDLQPGDGARAVDRMVAAGVHVE